jgi:hypothetical protein
VSWFAREVGVDLEGDVWVGVAELAADEHDVETTGDEQRGVAVAERVEPESAGRGDACVVDCRAEVFAAVAVVAAAAVVVAEDELVRFLVGGGGPAFA